MLLIFLWSATLTDLILGITWNGKDFINVFVKILMIAIGVIGVIVLLQQYGFIIQK